MQFKLILFFIFGGIIQCYSQDKNIQLDTLRISKKIVKLDAEEFAQKAIGIPEDSLSVLLKGAKHVKGKYGMTDIYYIYSKREKKNIPLEFWYRGDEDKSRVWKVEFISRESHYYKTNDLRTAFWIEYIRNPYTGKE